MKLGDLTGFAVDLGGTKTAAARIEAGEIAARKTVPTDRSAGLEAQLDTIAGLLAGLGHGRGAPLGVAVTGLVSRDGTWSAVNRATLPAIAGAPLADALRRRFGAARVCNDAAAATLAEAWFGAGTGCRDFVYLTVSTGVGGGIVIDGRPVESRRGLAGHFGFASAPLGEGPCGSGRRNTVEGVASGTAIAAAAAAGGHPELTAREVFAAATDGAGWAGAIVGRAAQAIATLIADTAAILDPESVALGGGVGLAPGFVERVTTALAAEPPLFRVPVVAAVMGHDGPLLGALAAARSGRDSDTA